WELEPLARFELSASGEWCETSSELPPSARAKMPDDWTQQFGKAFLGRVRYRRTFHKPTGLELGRRVWLRVEPARSAADVWLDGRRLGEVRERAVRWDITEALQQDNRLEIVVEHPAIDARRLAG